MSTTAQRRQALLDAFDVHEEMAQLLACLPRSPAVWADLDPELDELSHDLEQRGLLEENGGYWTTTEKGRAALIAYIDGHSESAYLTEFDAEFCDGTCEGE